MASMDTLSSYAHNPETMKNNPRNNFKVFQCHLIIYLICSDLKIVLLQWRSIVYFSVTRLHTRSWNWSKQRLWSCALLFFIKKQCNKTDCFSSLSQTLYQVFKHSLWVTLVSLFFISIMKGWNDFRNDNWNERHYYLIATKVQVLAQCLLICFFQFFLSM